MDEHLKQRGQRVVELRKQRCWSAERLAQEAGVSAKTISRIEKGGVDQPRDATIERVANALDVTEAIISGRRPSVQDIKETASQLDRMEETLNDVLSSLQKLLEQQGDRLNLHVDEDEDEDESGDAGEEDTG